MDLLWLGKPVWMWAVFMGAVLALLILDLGILHKSDKVISARDALLTYGFYILCALGFGAWIWAGLGQEKAIQYYTGYVIEQSLSMDNLFVMALIFGFFKIPRAYQHRVLFWGILGVVVLRGVMIGTGAALVAHFHWVLYLFSAFLIFSGIKMVAMGDHETDIGANPVLGFMRRHMRVEDTLHGHHFFVRLRDPNNKMTATYMTPLMVALVMIELADVVFAVDSVPAIFALTTDPYIVYTSNIFAILGLRTLYFALAAAMERFAYLKYALSAVLVFIGSKIFITDFVLGDSGFPPSVSLGVTFALLAAGVGYSLWKTRGRQA
ncbi:MAG: TerC family protein [Rhodospirillales bacterium]|nr:TerC family protein [Alphaproteobacteria bacterium]MCB9986275.1 TerC family protein [Rhodospirillales bacterium]USO07172.1 MAG: TerC family protein [Rhodospirillales bacterium]